MPNTSASLTIALLLDTDFEFGMRILDGVQSVARARPHWRLLPLHSTHEPLLEDLLRQGRLAGVIGALLSDRWVQGLPERRIPMINVSDLSILSSVPTVTTDNHAVGRLAAHHLLDCNVHSYGCLVDSASASARSRRRGFIRRLAESGVTVSCPAPSENPAPDSSWDDWLTQLRTPCGIFCGSDYLLRRLLPHIRRKNWRIPFDCALIGVGDSALDSILAGLEITSIPLPGQSIGKRAASLLAKMLDGERIPNAGERIRPSGITVRGSTLRDDLGDPIVRRARQWFRANLASPEGMEVVALFCGVSRRTLETNFKRELGHGPATEFRRLRLEQAKLLLRETSNPLWMVAEATGFSSPAHFSAVFQRATHRPPGLWRQLHQPHYDNIEQKKGK